MDQARVSPKVHEALAELQQYLSDAIAPLVVTDSIATLLKCPPGLVGSEIQAWSANQYRRQGTSVPVSDYLYHAYRKLFLMGEFDLVPQETLRAYLGSLKTILVEFCPPEDRELLLTNMNNLGETETATAAPALYVHRQAAPDRALATSLPTAAPIQVVQADRRLSLLLDRIEQQLPAGTRGESPARADMVSQVLAMVAGSAKNSAELQQYRDRLARLGVSASMSDMIRTLGQSLPDWSALQTAPASGSATPTREDSPVEAMHRIVSLEEDPVETAKRLHEMIQSAVEQFNAGALARAATILVLSARIIAEKKLTPSVIEGIQLRARASLDSQRLRQLAEDTKQHVLLQKVLDFFPSLSVTALLGELHAEQTRDRRRLLLALLTCHGAAARPEVLARLEESVVGFGDGDWHFQRNLLTLLRRIPAPPDIPPDAEIDLAVRLTEPGHPIGLVKEAVANLGQLKHERAESVLIQRLEGYEYLMLKPDEAPYSVDELGAILDRVAGTLARSRWTRGRRFLVDHALKRQPKLGNTLARLADLGGQDLSDDEEVVGRLLEALRAELPRRVLGLALPKHSQRALSLIAALSATRTPEVMSLLKEIAERFPAEKVGRAAARALEGPEGAFRIARTSDASLSGDLGLFGLPALLQNLSNSAATGTLGLLNPSGAALSTIAFENGKVIGCHSGHLTGVDALYQLFERPEPGTFTFASRKGEEASGMAPNVAPTDIIPLMLEGMRRYDELRQACAIVPDEATFEATGVKGSGYAGERDRDLQRTVLKRATTGVTARGCEADLPADSYRIRRLLVHWVEQGALRLV